jgi:polyisoprenoid-binding protein YceI
VTATRRRRRWPWILGGVVIVAALAVVVGPFVYIHFIQADPRAAPTFENADKSTTTTAATGPASTAAAGATTTTTAAPASGAGSSGASSSGVDGAWKVASGSEAQYRVNEVLFGQSTTAVGHTSNITGDLTIAGTTATTGSFSVDLTKVTSDQSQRDQQFHGRIMNTARFPTATFTLTKPIDFGTLPADKVQITESATGDLTLHGVTKSVTVPLTARRNGANIEVQGSIPITFADWNIPNPSNGPVTTEDHGSIAFLLVFARS